MFVYILFTFVYISSFDNMSNDDAVRVLKEVVQKPGPIKLVVAKCWRDSGHSNSAKAGYLSLPRTGPPGPPHMPPMSQGNFYTGPGSGPMSSSAK